MKDSTRRLYKLGQGKKTVSLYFPEINKTYTTKNIEKDQISLTEALMNGNNLEFVGCISSTFQTRVHGATDELKDKRVVVSVDIVGQNDPQVIFNGYVYSSATRSDLAYKDLVCYDELHKKAANKDVSAWYKSLTFPITMRNLRNSFWNYVGIAQENANLPNDSIVIDRQYNPNIMNALDVAKSICQFNGVCGIMNRENKFEYRVPATKDVYYAPYPGNHTYPNSFYPGADGEAKDWAVENFFYMSLQSEEYLTNKITRVEVKDDNKSQPYGYGSGTNKYIIQGNIFVYGLTDAQKVIVAKNIYDRIKNFQYRPVNYTAPGLPFAEVGSVQSFYVMDWLNGSGERVKRSFPLLNRTLKGINELTDKCDIKGKKEQTEFVSSLNVKVDLIDKSSENFYTKDEIDSRLEHDYYTKPETDIAVADITTDITDTAIAQMETPTGLAFASVYQLPASPRANTLYGIQGGIIIVR